MLDLRMDVVENAVSAKWKVLDLGELFRGEDDNHALSLSEHGQLNWCLGLELRSQHDLDSGNEGLLLAIDDSRELHAPGAESAVLLDLLVDDLEYVREPGLSQLDIHVVKEVLAVGHPVQNSVSPGRVVGGVVEQMLVENKVVVENVDISELQTLLNKLIYHGFRVTSLEEAHRCQREFTRVQNDVALHVRQVARQLNQGVLEVVASAILYTVGVDVLLLWSGRVNLR
jgi:hypothetical protein